MAYRPLDRALPLASILSFRHPRSVARDNTVKYRWRTLQLLPGPERTSYAGTQVEVLERPGGELSVQHQGRRSPHARHRRARGAEGGTLRAGPEPRTTSASPQGSAPEEHPGGSPRSLLPPRR